MSGIYEAGFVEKLFDEMSGTNERVNLISSFGSSRRWRRRFVQEASIKPGMVVCDLMCGMGECWPEISRELPTGGRIVALDISGGMLRGTGRRQKNLRNLDVSVHRQDALESTLGDGCADRVVCGFGVRTLSEEQRQTLAAEISRILKPGGRFSLVEVSVPGVRILRRPYVVYLKKIIPLVGMLLLGNPDNYRMLGVHTEKFGNCRDLRDALARRGLRAVYREYFFGCASGVTGAKPESDAPL